MIHEFRLLGSVVAHQGLLGTIKNSTLDLPDLFSEKPHIAIMAGITIDPLKLYNLLFFLPYIKKVVSKI